MYVNFYYYLLFPSPGGNNLHLYIDLHLYLSNCILFCNLSYFYWGRAKFNKSSIILALYIFICSCKFEIIQCILKFKCICICFLSYYTYSDTEYSVYWSILPECYSVFSYFSHLCLPWGIFWAPTGDYYPNCPPNRGIPSKSLGFA